MSLSNPLAFLQQNPILVPAIILMPIAVALVIFVLMRFSERREERKREREWEIIDSTAREETSGKADAPQSTGKPVEERMLPKPKSERELTIEELTGREERLREREEKLKRKKMLELEEKEKNVERKHVKDIVREERKISDLMEDKQRRELQMEEMRDNRKRLVKLIELAEDRYNDGLMSEKNFRSIMEGYQKELVEVDVEMAKLRGYNI